jgi:hypothetical protein
MPLRPATTAPVFRAKACAATPGRLLLVALLLPFVPACSSSKVDGSVSGTDFGRVESALFMTQSGAAEEAMLLLTNYPDACATYTAWFEQGGEGPVAGQDHALSSRFYLLDPVTPGTWTIVGADETYEDGITYLHARFLEYTADGTWDGPSAVSGQLVIDSMDDAWVTGTAAMTLETGDTLEITFEAETCTVEDF